jgi:hypothetical protein
MRMINFDNIIIISMVRLLHFHQFNLHTGEVPSWENKPGCAYLAPDRILSVLSGVLFLG